MCKSSENEQIFSSKERVVIAIPVTAVYICYSVHQLCEKRAIFQLFLVHCSSRAGLFSCFTGTPYLLYPFYIREPVSAGVGQESMLCSINC